MQLGRRSILRLLVFSAAAALATSSCLSPTLPLPPPEEPDTLKVETDDPTAWTVAGACSPGARVTVLNEATGRGAVYEDRDNAGRYSVQIEAEPCALGSVVQAFADDPESLSASTRFVFQGRSSAGLDDPSACR